MSWLLTNLGSHHQLVVNNVVRCEPHPVECTGWVEMTWHAWPTIDILSNALWEGGWGARGGVREEERGREREGKHSIQMSSWYLGFVVYPEVLPEGGMYSQDSDEPLEITACQTHSTSTPSDHSIATCPFPIYCTPQPFLFSTLQSHNKRCKFLHLFYYHTGIQRSCSNLSATQGGSGWERGEPIIKKEILPIGYIKNETRNFM